jgi:cell division protein FtsQ
MDGQRTSGGRVRDRLDIPRFWWRAAEKPRSRPRAGSSGKPQPLTPADASLLEPSDDRPAPSSIARPHRSWASRATALVAVALIGAGIFTVGIGPFKGSSSISEGVDQLMINAGLSVDEIGITGHRYTLDNDIFTALQLDRPTSLLRFSSEAARGRVEALSWVHRASVTRVLPNSVEVRITERKPVAVWLHDEAATLVDAEGRHLARVPASTLPALPRISGAGAPEAIGTLVALLGAFPEVAKRVSVSVRVGQRRWWLDLDNGSRIHLPAEGEIAALGRLVRINGADGALTEPGRMVDLRIEDRIAVAPRKVGTASSADPGQSRPRKSASAL